MMENATRATPAASLEWRFSVKSRKKPIGGILLALGRIIHGNYKNEKIPLQVWQQKQPPKFWH
jgi:hypothetical protein